MSSKITTRGQYLGYLKQDDASNQWTAANASTAAFKTINGQPGVSLPNPSVEINQLGVTSTAGLMSQRNRQHIDSISGLHSLPMTVWYNHADMTHFFIAGFQSVSSSVAAGGSTYQNKHVIKPVDAVLDFSNNGGYLNTIAEYTYNASSGNSDGVILKNAIANRFVYNHNRNAVGQEKIARADIDWMGNELSTEQYFDGSWVAQPSIATAGSESANDLGVDFKLGLTVGGSLISSDMPEAKSFSMTLENNMSPSSRTSNGIAGNYDLAPALTVNILMDYYSDLHDLALKAYKAGTNVNFTYTTGTLSGTSNDTESLVITHDTCTITAVPKTIDGDYVGINLQLALQLPTGGSWGDLIQFYSNSTLGY